MIKKSPRVKYEGAFVKLQRILFCLGLLIQSPLVFSSLPQVVVQKIEPVEVFDRLVYPGRVEAKRGGPILAENAGVIEKLKVQLGDRVKKGDVIASVKQLDPVYNYRAVEVRSTIDGLVTAVNVNLGAHVSVGDTLVEVIDPSMLRVRAEVSARDLPLLEVGMLGELSLRGREQTERVKIEAVSPIINRVTGTATLDFVFVDEQAAIPVGSIGRLEVRANEQEGFLIPAEALFYRGDKAFIRKAGAENKVEVTELKTGRKKNNLIEVLDGVSAGDEVILRSSSYLREGAEVQVTNRQE